MDWVNQDKIWIVNGHVEKIDANFNKAFGISEISVDNLAENSNQGKLFIGSYPESELHMIQI
jgi:hypothetical protein